MTTPSPDADPSGGESDSSGRNSPSDPSGTSGLTGKRAASRARTNAAIMAAARAEIARHGGGALSMREVARQVGMVSSAVYRYYPTREALLTAMILESYGHLAEALDAAATTDAPPAGTTDTTDATDAADAAHRWIGLGTALREWARHSPHEFQLIYGTPIPGYVAPPETIPAAAAVAAPFLAVVGDRDVHAYANPELTAQMGALIAPDPMISPSAAAGVLAELAALVGVISLELSGHLVGTADPADHLYDALLARQTVTLQLT